MAQPSLPLAIVPISTAASTSPSGDPASSTATDSSVTLTVPSSSDSSTDSSSDNGSLTIVPMSPVPTPSQSQSQGQGTPSAPSPTAPWSFDRQPALTATTCQPYEIHWNVSSRSLSAAHLTLYVMNITITTGSSGTSTSSLNMSLVVGQPLLANSYTWPAVTVPAGTYAMYGIDPDGSPPTAQSYLFAVQAGPNTTCIPPGTSTDAGAGDAQNQNGNTTATTPVSTAASGTSSHAEVIAAGTVSGVVLLACLAAFLLQLTSPRAETAPWAHGAMGP